VAGDVTDRSLDEFATPSETAADADADADADVAGAAATDADTTPTTDPATPTMRWAVDAVCSACGSSAPRRWRDDDVFVCAGCKEW
jgi:hypothetical protein